VTPISRFVAVAVCGLLAAPLAAQQPQRPAVQSPVVDGGKVTFAIYAPKAAAVILRSGEVDRLVPAPNR